MSGAGFCRTASAIFTGVTTALYPAGDLAAPSGTNGQALVETYAPNSSTVIKRVGVKRRILHSITYLKVPVAAETVEIVKADGTSYSPAWKLGDGTTAPRGDHFAFGPNGVPFPDAFGVKLGHANTRVLIVWEDAS